MALFECDFEAPCVDFIFDYNWGFTDGLHPRPLAHDHTLNNSSGHYMFYNPQIGPTFTWAEIQTANWTQVITDQAVCFKMWYYTPRLSMRFSIQLVQGDDERLVRIVDSIPGKDPSINDWTPVTVLLPAEKVKVFIRLNASTSGPLAFDDFSIDYCNESHPSPPETIFACDFETSCNDEFISLPEYPYQWSIIQASDAPKQETQAPPVDYTFRNGSGHYVWLPTYDLVKKGNVGYLATKTSFNITANETYCLNFQYYGYGRSYFGNLNVYSWLQDKPHTVQVLWPLRSSSEYIYTSNQWTWSIVNLPTGYYSLLFGVDSWEDFPHTFALDNIAITSCDYPPSELTPYDYLLTFSCDFDNWTMCDMINGDRQSMSSFNFTVFTGNNVPNPKLGPTRDHTSNSTSGGFLYWNRYLPYVAWNNGRIHPSKDVQQNLGMCVRFAYYVKSVAINKNGTMLVLGASGCYGANLWIRSMDDSQGWQVAIVPVSEFPCAETFYFEVGQQDPDEVSVAFDDIEIGQCSTLNPTTTTSIATTSTTKSTSTTTSTTIITRLTTHLTTTHLTTTSITSMTSITSTLSPSTSSLPGNARQLFSTNKFFLLAVYFLSRLF